MLRWFNRSPEAIAMSRREGLRAGFLALGGLTLSQLLRLQAQAAAPKKDTAVLLVFVHGGPSHLETYDMKPQASAEIRGPFMPISTKVPGIHVCEYLPEHAAIADKFTLIRSCCHDEADHFAGHRRFLSGYGKLKQGFGYEPHYPMVGAVANRLLNGRVPGMPAAVSVGGVVVNGPDYAAGIGEGFWPSIYRVPILNNGLRDGWLQMATDRMADRSSLRSSLDGFRRAADVSGAMGAGDEFERQAIDILASGKAQKAFDLSQESEATREAYGPDYGAELLTALRLVEAGVSFVTMRVHGGSSLSKAYDWDDHAVNWDMREAMIGRLPRYDRVISRLIRDLYDRGLENKVLVVVTGEFGRTPRLENNNGRIGRDHWPGAMSILMTGGGIRTGQVIGATDEIGARPKEHTLDPRDILATIYDHLGIDPHQYIEDNFGRPLALTDGNVVKELWTG